LFNDFSILYNKKKNNKNTRVKASTMTYNFFCSISSFVYYFAFILYIYQPLSNGGHERDSNFIYRNS